MALLCAMPAYGVRNWEPARADKLQESKVVKHTSDVEVRVLHDTILISTPRPVSVKVFSILGQLISQENLPAGSSQLSLGMHGVFIVKIGAFTCKVAL
jgi:hypothetical protein